MNIQNKPVSASLESLISKYIYNKKILELVLKLLQSPEIAEQEFPNLISEIEKNRHQTSSHTERDKNSWYDAESHSKAIQVEEKIELLQKFEDEKALLELAASINYENGVEQIFASLIKTSDEIRKRTVSYEERDKNSWQDSELHEIRVEKEKQAESIEEFKNNFELFRIAQSVGYKKGSNMIATKLESLSEKVLKDNNKTNAKHR